MNWIQLINKVLFHFRSFSHSLFNFSSLSLFFFHLLFISRNVCMVWVLNVMTHFHSQQCMRESERNSSTYTKKRKIMYVVSEQRGEKSTNGKVSIHGVFMRSVRSVCEESSFFYRCFICHMEKTNIKLQPFRCWFGWFTNGHTAQISLNDANYEPKKKRRKNNTRWASALWMYFDRN